MTLTIAPPTGDPLGELRSRCRTLGLLAWVLSADGTFRAEPEEPGLAGLWTKSSELLRLLREAGRAPLGPGAVITDVFPGCWVIQVSAHVRRSEDRLLALALGRSALASESFEGICRSAQLDPPACRRALSALATFDGATVRRLASAVEWSAADLAGAREARRAIAGFTTQLTDAYETIEVLYQLGRSIQELDQPEHFTRTMCDRFRETAGFAWVLARFGDDARLPRSLAERLIVSGRAPLGEDALRRLTGDFLAQHADDAGPIYRSDLCLVEDQSEGTLLIQPVLMQGRQAGLLIVGDKEGDDPQVSSYETKLLEAASGYLGAFLDNAGLFAEQQAMFVGSLRALSAAIDAKDRYTCGHSERVAHVASELARLAGMDEHTCERVHIGGLLHDVGKIGVPEAVLCKPGRLSDDEFAAIKRHPEIGHRILKDIPRLADILPGVLHHHERWDGRGYPHRLAGEQIPMMARLLAIADTFDAMSSTRSYRPAMPRQDVLAEIGRCAGTQFDPALAPLILRLDLGAYDRLFSRHAAEHGVSPASTPGQPAPADLPERRAA